MLLLLAERSLNYMKPFIVLWRLWMYRSYVYGLQNMLDIKLLLYPAIIHIRHGAVKSSAMYSYGDAFVDVNLQS